MNQPLVAIIGRPNVGKSTLFNRITESRKSIVGDEPGITRDRIYGEVSWRAKTFELVDTGGIVPDDEAVIPANIFKQAGQAIAQAQSIIWVVDARAGITPLDEEIGILLRNLSKPVFIAANKSETKKVAEEAAEFYKFGFRDVTHPQDKLVGKNLNNAKKTGICSNAGIQPDIILTPAFR